MRLLYDLWAAQPHFGKYHGGSTYARAVLERLVELRRDEEISVYYDPSRWLDQDLLAIVRHRWIKSLHVEDKRALQALLASRRYDRFYSAVPYDLYDLDLRGIDFVMTIHGLRALEVPTDDDEIKYAHGLRRWLKVKVKRLGLPLYVRRHKERFRRLIYNGADHTTIITPSWHTKYALLNRFAALPPETVRVLYSPLRPLPSYSDDRSNDRVTVLQALGLQARGFYLLVNAGRWVKNALRAIRALDTLFTVQPAVGKTVFVLGVQKGQQLHRHVRNRSRFLFHDYVPDAILTVLYREAFALVYPSLSEGFGYPPLECMQFGTPVVCSANAAIPEVCGDSALLFNPLSSDEIQNRISYLTLEPGVWDRYSRLALQHSSRMARLQSTMLDELCELILRRTASSSSRA